MALKKACHDGIIANNVAQFADVPGKEPFSTDPYTIEESKKLLEAAKGNKLEMPIRLALYTGLRRGEALGLQWEQVDFKSKTICIDRSFKYISHKQVLIHELKNKNSKATLRLPESLAVFLKHEYNRQSEQYLMNGGDYNPDHFVCVDDEGRPFSLHQFDVDFRKLIEEKNLRKIRFHDLRHSCASILVNNGYDLKMIQELMRHGSFSTTADYYSHISQATKEKMAEALDEAMQKII